MPTYSLVIPAYNEEGVIAELVARLTEVMDALDGDAEAILVDDGSRDRTYELMLEAAQRRTRASGSSGSRATSATRSRSPPASTSRRATR